MIYDNEPVFNAGEFGNSKLKFNYYYTNFLAAEKSTFGGGGATSKLASQCPS